MTDGPRPAAPGRTPGEPGTPVLELVDGAVALGGRPVLRGIDLTVHGGEVVAVLGTNGSGKSTLVRAALGLVPTHRGEVRLFGTSVGRFHDWHRIGFVPQRATAAAGVPASVTEVVASGRLSRRPFWRPAGRADRAAVTDALRTVDLLDRRRDDVATLSGGQQQRVLIARALASGPELLVLDEPTAGVDLGSQEALARTLRRLLDRGATVLLVAHELGPLAPLVSRAVVMRDGRVAYDGPPDAVPRDPHGHHHPHDHPEPGHRTADGRTPHAASPLDTLAERTAHGRGSAR